MAPPTNAAAYLVNHVVLPLDLPQANDYDAAHENTLIEATQQALHDLRNHVGKNHQDAVMSAITTIDSLLGNRDTQGFVSEVALAASLKSIAGSSVGSIIPLEVKAQNAGLIVRRDGDNIVFESFELSPTNEAAMGCKGRLRRIFPGLASRIPMSKMQKPELQQTLASTLAKMSSDADFQLLKTRANTTDPGFVTDFLMHVITAIGEPCDSIRISKNTRDEVLLKQAHLPWRRSPLWLLIRVTVQLVFHRSRDTQSAKELYKAFGLFALSHILGLAKAHWASLGNDSLRCLSAKTVRRLHKFDSMGEPQCLLSEWKDQIRCNLTEFHKLLTISWEEVVDNPALIIDTSNITSLQPEKDLDMAVMKLDAFLVDIASVTSIRAVCDFQRTFEYPVYPAGEVPNLFDTSDGNQIYRLFATEMWVEKNIEAWVESHAEDPSSCGELRRLMQVYHSSANSVYKRDPASLSIMYLTLCDIWVQCDILACEECPLLKEYDPEVQLDELQCLSLPLRTQMKRLHDVEAYVYLRRRGATKGYPSVFHEFGHISSFAVKYFESKQGNALQALLAEIERTAAEKIRKKCEELADLKEQYNELIRHYDDNGCEYEWTMVDHEDESPISRHSSTCSRCVSKKQADALNITVYEKPLSSNMAEAKGTVFELKVPEAYSDWRDATFHLVTNILGIRDESAGKLSYALGLDKHQDLSHMLPERFSARRITIVSAKKSRTAKSEPLKTIVNLEDNDVCLEQGSKYTYFDKVHNSFTGGTRKFTEELARTCSYMLPQRAQALKRYLHRPPSAPDGLPSNAVIADQISCPLNFSVEEFKTFATVPLGRSIMYENILVQPAMPTLDFAKTETQCLMQQVVHQAGPSNEEVSRTLHHNLQDSEFCHSMLAQLETALKHLSENWESWKALASFTLLTRRILSLTLSDEVATRSMEYLLSVREVCLKWLRTLQDRAINSTNQEQRSDLYRRTMDIALLSTSTLDVEDKYLSKVFEQTTTVSALAQCSIIINENQGSLCSDTEGLCNIMYKSWKRMMYRILPSVQEKILLHNDGLNQAIVSNWDTFQPTPGTHWTVLSQLQTQWLHTTTSTLTVHFDLLTGELLVNGRPLTRLPAQFTQHITYSQLFGKTVLEVGPCELAGMDFTARSTRHGYKLHFGMKGQDMLLMAVKENARLKFLPPWTLEDSLPQTFTVGYTHWYDCDRDEVIFRKQASPWLETINDLRLTHTGRTWRLMQGPDAFVNTTGKTASTLLPIFRPLEDVHHIHIKWNATTNVVDITLPRFQLEFYVLHQTSVIRSRQYRTMTVDSDQNLGTLVGLSSKLVLRSASSQEDRMVLIPLPSSFTSDSVKYTKGAIPHHVDVTIVREGAAKACSYSLDATLRRVLDSGDIQSKLLLAYLHGLTSHCLPDPFTGYTGTESALAILKSSSIRSFESLTPENVSMLTCIAKLTPGRTSHTEKAQQVHWDTNLPALSQDPGFYILAKEVVAEAQKAAFLHPGSDLIEFKGMPTIRFELQERDTIRSSSFRLDGFGAENFTCDEDEDYDARDVGADPERSQRAFVAATLITQERAAPHEVLPDLKTGLFRGHLDTAIIRSSSTPYEFSGLSCDPCWLQEPSAFLAEHWCSLHLALTKAPKKHNPFNIMMWLATMAYSTAADMDAVSTLAAFYRLRDMASIRPPTAASSFNRSRGDSWANGELEKLFVNYRRAPIDCPQGNMPRRDGEENKKWLKRITSTRTKPLKNAEQKFASALREQWPCSNPSMPTANEIKLYIKVSEAMIVAKANFKAKHDNLRFSEYLDVLSQCMARQEVQAIPAPRHILSIPTNIGAPENLRRYYSLNDVFIASAPELGCRMSEQSLFVESHESPLSPTPQQPAVPLLEKVPALENAGNYDALNTFCWGLGCSTTLKFQNDYVATLRASCIALAKYEVENKTQVAQITTGTLSLLQEYLKACKSYFEALHVTMTNVVRGKGGSVNEIAFELQQTPRLSPTAWLKCLNQGVFQPLSEQWKTAIIYYACAITHLHRAERMITMSDKPYELAQELQNLGHTNWSPREFPETLLMEAESGILVRPVQETIAKSMRDPPRGENAVCQLNMGEGKSSVIVPILAAALADTKKLVRIIVAKPQSKQMLQVLITKLGGLLNRRIYHLPFTRELRPNAMEAKTILSLCQDCMHNRGVILAQPEHILSFKLMSVETVLLDQQEVSTSLLEIQQFLNCHTRDIVDESDENFSPHFELVYTMGSQQSIDFAPQRWLIIQQILGLVSKYAPQVKERYPVSIEVHHIGDGMFPRVRLLRDDATGELLKRIAKHIVEHGLTGLSTRSLSAADERVALEEYILIPTLTPDQINAVEGSRFWTDLTKNAILLVRGVLACGILRFILLTKRWRVNFGLDLERVPSTLLAVPYRFKDGPSRAAEYSHPEVLLLLTQLSHYYGGLSDEQMFHVMQHISNSDQAALQYTEWVDTAALSLPAAFRSLSGINLKDRQHCIQHVFPHLRYSKACIDYFLSRLVFPKEVKEFTSKLSASGWDMGAIKPNPTTGFSGTKDTMHLLPLAVKHHDLPSQGHINALVLSYLLNTSSVELLAPREETTDAEHILHAVVKSKPEIRVVLDCGAAILEQTNKQVVEAWLRLTDPVQVHAAVFFQEEELSILDRTGRVELFQTSPFAKQLDACVVYLDEAHTRGTDLRLPRHYRACLTLGRALSKDKLIQGCMRMRQLGKGQSIVFLVPEEITTKILEYTGHDFDALITVRDVLIWSIRETWIDLKKSMPLWAVQGHRYISHEQLSCDATMTPDEAKHYLEDEGQTIESRYGPGFHGNKLTAKSKNWNTNNTGIAVIVSRCHKFGAMTSISADMEEEQEVCHLAFSRFTQLTKVSENLPLSKKKNDRLSVLNRCSLRHMRFTKTSLIWLRLVG
jgi:hypothetical protein